VRAARRSVDILVSSHVRPHRILQGRRPPLTEEDEQLRNRLWPRLSHPIILETSVRVMNVMRKAEINYLGQLVQLTEKELMSHRNFGQKSLNEVKEVLSEWGLHLGMKEVVEHIRWRPPDVGGAG
jgi:DNA-directed RNA polymerase alpha subunit